MAHLARDLGHRWRRTHERLTATRGRKWAFRAGVAGLAAVVLALVAFAILYAAVDLPAEPEQATTSVVLDAEGNVLAELYDEEHRVPVELDQMAETVEEAVVAAEDRNFWSHSGLDPLAIVRAFWNDVRGRDLQGGSTITQQLVKNTYLSTERTLTRKAREAVLAIKVERELSKEEILERYLNTVYFGRGAYGIEVAARAYFGVHARDLDVPQAALLAGLIRAPEAAEPDVHPDRAEARRAGVLDAMVRTGALSEDEAERAKRTPLGTVPRRDGSAPIAAAGGAAYFVDQVRQWAVERYGERVAFGGGLRIYTTLDRRAQDAAEAAVTTTLGAPTDPEAALVSIDRTGAIKAMVGGRDFGASKVNLALGEAGGGSGRQAGSTFKPFVLAAAIEAGIPVRSVFDGPAEMTLDTPAGPWEVHNYDDRGYGPVDLTEATVNSVNTVYAQLILEVGPENVAALARRAGIESALEPVPSLTLGTSPVSPLEMARAFMTFGNRGQRVTPYHVTTVTDADDNVLYRHEADSDEVLPRQHADLVNHVLQQAVERGTGRAADIGRDVAGKTGTTQEYGDAWFAGYTPELATVVWMGYPEGQSRPMTDVRGRRVTGGSFPAMIWQRYMREVTAGVDTGRFHEPPEDLLNESPPEQFAPPPPPTTTTSSTTSTSSTTTSSTSSTTSTSTTTSSTSSTTTTTSSTSSTTTTQPKQDE